MRESLRCALGALVVAASATSQSYVWHQQPGTTRLFAITQPNTWSQARAQAQALGGDLAEVLTAFDQDFLYATFGGTQCLWIGFSDEVQEGTWRWNSGAWFGYRN